MYARILAAVDGSHTSDLALAEAVKLCKELGAQLRIVHVLDTNALFSGELEFVDIVPLKKAMADAGARILQRAAVTAASAGIEAETKLLDIPAMTQRIVDVIAAEAEAWPADLIVFGTHGRRGFSHLVLGSVAEGLVRIAPAPVLLIRGT
ncbi:MAG: universal stress protein [Gammaproteobacteria bacterium]